MLKKRSIISKWFQILFPYALLPAYLLVFIPMSPFVLLLIYSVQIIWTVNIYQFYVKTRNQKEVLIFYVVMLISSFLFGYALSKVNLQWTVVESVLLGLGLSSAFVPNVLVAGKNWKKQIPEIQASHNDIDEHSKIRCPGSGRWMRKFICRGYLFWMMMAISFFIAIRFIGDVADEMKGLIAIYVVFVLCIFFAAGIGKKGSARLIKTEFKLKKILIYDFDNNPHIPILIVYHQLLAYLFLLIGIVLWSSLWTFYKLGFMNAEDPQYLILLISIYYSAGVGGLMSFVMMQIREYDSLRNKDVILVDSKWIR